MKRARNHASWTIPASLVAVAALAALAPDAFSARAKTEAKTEHYKLEFSQDDSSVVPPPPLPEPGTESSGVVWDGSSGSTGDLVKFGENIHIAPGQRVRGDVVSVGGGVDVEGIVDGDAVALGGDVRIQGRGDVRGQAISLGGKVIHEGGGALRGSSVSMPAFDFNLMNFIGQGIKVIQLIVVLGLTLLIAWAATWIVPERTERATDFARTRPGPSFLWGLGALIAIAPSAVAVALVSALLCITLIGIPVAILLLVGYAAGLAVLVVWGYVIGAGVVGHWVALRLRPLDGEPTLRRSLLYGVSALFLPCVVATVLKSLGLLVPFAGGLGGVIGAFGAIIVCGVFLVGLGAALASRGGSAPRMIEAAAIAVPPVPPAPMGAPTTPPPVSTT